MKKCETILLAVNCLHISNRYAYVIIHGLHTKSIMELTEEKKYKYGAITDKFGLKRGAFLNSGKDQNLIKAGKLKNP